MPAYPAFSSAVPVARGEPAPVAPRNGTQPTPQPFLIMVRAVDLALRQFFTAQRFQPGADYMKL